MSKIPLDIKVVNEVTRVLFVVFIFLIFLNAFEYFFKNKFEHLNAMYIKGDVLHSDVSSIQSNILPSISGGFYNINLAKTKQIFETIPWVNQAVIKRVYPGQIEVKLSEFRAKAIWGAREDMRLVDEKGVIFDANTEDDEYDQMPQLIGPEGQGKFMLNMFKDVSKAFIPLKQKIKLLELNARGSWVAIMEGGAHIELGRGNTSDVIERVSKFANGVEQLLSKLNKKNIDIQYVDLRHTDGYAMRMHGVSTLDLTTVTSALKK